MTLTPKQRAQLRSLAHPLKPILHLGKDGLTEAVLQSILEAFNSRELLKIKVQSAAPLSAAEAGAEIAARLPEVEHVQTIGRTVVLYRRHPEKPEIELRS
ncbi:MAG TPA: YhbY family RNA-binding protein [Longimicrobiaceae bacterium]